MYDATLLQKRKNDSTVGGKSILTLALVLSVLMGVPRVLHAATLLLNPSNGSYAVGSVVPVEVIVDTEGETINAVSGELSYDATHVRPASIKISDSLVDLWIKQPSTSASEDIVAFEGLILNPGFSGKGKIATINFEVIGSGSTIVSFVSGSALANDGMGTNVLTRFSESALSTYGSGGETIATRPINTELPIDPSTLVMDSLRPPVVTGYTLAPARIESFSLQGVTYPAAVVTLWLQRGDDAPDIAAVQADMAGNFSYSRNNPYKNLQPIAPASVLSAVRYLFTGMPYRFWLTAKISGAETPPTQAFDLKVGGFSMSEIFFGFSMLPVLILGGFLLYEIMKLQKQGAYRKRHVVRHH